MITFTRVMRSEWTKIRSVRATWITLGATALLTVVLSGAIGYGVGNPFPTLSPGASAAVLLGWVALLLAGGVALLRHRDA
jgi:hypothetical protein